MMKLRTGTRFEGVLAFFALLTVGAFFVGATCQGAPAPTGVSVTTTPEGGIEACVTLALKAGCVCPSEAGR